MQLIALLPLFALTAFALPTPAAFPEAAAANSTAPAAQSELANELTGSLNSLQSSLNVIKNLQGIEGCSVIQCITDMAPALTECSTAAQSQFIDPTQDAQCLSKIVTTSEGFVSLSFLIEPSRRLGS